MNTSTNNYSPSTETPALLDTAAEQDPFREPDANVSLLYRLFEADEGGEPLTPTEQADWDRYKKDSEEWEKRRPVLCLVDLAHVMENGVTEPEMLTANLVKNEWHLVFGNKESGKTWLVLLDVVELLQRGETVIWVDKEMGKKNIANRLITLGASPDDVRAHFTYMEHPSMDMTSDSKLHWNALLDFKKPALIVVDAQTEVLADADLNENSGTDVAKWAQAYMTPARRIGSAVCMIDHVGHLEAKRGVGSRQKGAAAKVELLVEQPKTKPFGRDKIGEIRVERMKNTVDAPIRKTRTFKIGGDDGKFVFEEIDSGEDSKSEENAERTRKIEEAILAVLKEQKEPISQSQLVAFVGRKKPDVVRAAQQMARSDLSPVHMEPFGNSIRYSLAELEPASAAASLQ